MPNKRFKKFLSVKGFKFTKEREEIFSEIMLIEGHFDPDELFITMKTKGSKVSRASIYRTIPLLVDGGLIEKVEMTDRHAHYEKKPGKRHHDHMICSICGKVIEFYSPELEKLQESICRKEKFKALRHSLEIMGRCGDCG
ncbi:MAG: transcriptional repressor [Nitrospirae bacterium]|nr:MAG: transcriptional repressor [Nitrospirota bacterium]